MNGKKLEIALFALLERANAVSIPQIAQLLGSDEETIWELLENLVFAYDSVDLRLDLGGAHASLRRGSTSRMFRLNADETAVLLDALEAYGFAPDGELASKLVRAKGLLEGEGAVGGGAAAGGRLRTSPRGVAAEVMQTLAAACEDEAHHVVRIEYQKEGAAQPEPREVEPYLLVSDADHALLEAYDRQREGWRSFRLDRIKAASVLETVFTPKPYREDAAHGSATLLFDAAAELPDWPGLKRVRTAADGSVQARIPWYGTLWLPKRIIALQGAVEPLEPAELRDACASYARRLLQDCA